MTDTRKSQNYHKMDYLQRSFATTATEESVLGASFTSDGSLKRKHRDASDSDGVCDGERAPGPKRRARGRPPRTPRV